MIFTKHRKAYLNIYDMFKDIAASPEWQHAVTMLLEEDSDLSEPIAVERDGYRSFVVQMQQTDRDKNVIVNQFMQYYTCRREGARMTPYCLFIGFMMEVQKRIELLRKHAEKGANTSLLAECQLSESLFGVLFSKYITRLQNGDGPVATWPHEGMLGTLLRNRIKVW